jgi:hypothetical protein
MGDAKSAVRTPSGVAPSGRTPSPIPTPTPVRTTARGTLTAFSKVGVHTQTHTQTRNLHKILFIIHTGNCIVNMAYLLLSRAMEDELRRGLGRGLGRGVRSSSVERSDESPKTSTFSALVAIIIVIYLLAFVWWISIFVRARSQLSGNDVVIVFLLNILLSPAVAEIALQILRKK